VDSITHIALGAIVGEAIAGKTLGKRAMFIGAIAQSIPDIDFMAAFWLEPADNLLAHRGFTHSFLFAVLITAALAFIAHRTHPAHKFSYASWSVFLGVEIFIHLLLDACNAYGVGWFEPFSHQRISFDILFVADPFYSVWLGIALVVLMSLDSKSLARRFWIWFGLLASSAYFLYAVSNKIMITRDTKAALQKQQIPYQRVLTTPTPLNTWLWYIVVQDDKGFHTTYRSVADQQFEHMDFTYFPQQDELLAPLITLPDVHQLKRFSQGYFTVEQSGDTLIFNDLRFGQVAGWDDPKANFVFHYYLNYPDANLLVIQRGRFTNWNRKTFTSMVRRIQGHQ
jgi:inner membrane protein